jgi:hypothetical protein
MFRALCLLRFISIFVIFVSSFGLAQISNYAQSRGSAPSSAVQVVYVIDGSTLTTYNVDPQTLQAAKVGTITLSESIYPGLITSPNGRFLYYSAYQNSSEDDHELYVYDTYASGLPANTPIQKMSAKPLAGMLAHPSGKFLYMALVGTSNGLTVPYAVVRNLIDENNGKLSQPVTEATYQLDSESSGNDCYLSILGFNPAGTAMYDAILCNGPHGSGSATYNQRSVDLQTGALGPDQLVYSFSYYAGSSNARVQFEQNLLFAFIGNYNQGPNADLVDIYQMPNVSTPVINCTKSMWAVCGNFGYALAHPSGEYVFLMDSANTTDIGELNLTTQQIVQTSSIPYEVQQFSTDGTIAYGVNDVNGALDIEIYGFSAASGQVTQGGTISVPSDLDSWFAAQRY